MLAAMTGYPYDCVILKLSDSSWLKCVQGAIE